MPDIAVVDVDDLHCEEQIIKWLLPLHEAVPALVVTCYAIPNKLGPVHELVTRYPWIIFAVHGWEHSQFETRAWSEDLAKEHITQALTMGYSHLFKAPNWLEEPLLEEVCAELSIVLHHHTDYKPTFKGLRAFPGPTPRTDFESVHTHIQRNPATDFIEGHPQFTSEHLSQFERFATPIELAGSIE